MKNIPPFEAVSRFEKLDGSSFFTGVNKKQYGRINDNSPEFEQVYLKSLKKLKLAQKLADVSNFFRKLLPFKQKTNIFPVELPEKTMRDSLVFRDLFESLTSGECTYCTYLNELVQGGRKAGGYVPHYVQCVAKNCLDGNVFKEVFSSRLANMLGVNVVYNTTQLLYNGEDAQKSVFPDCSSQDLFSVDCVPYTYTFETMLQITNKRWKTKEFKDWDLETIVQAILVDLQELAESQDIVLTDEMIEDFERDFCKQYLFKKILCSDGDFDSHNVGVLYSQEKGDIRIGPAFDMESLFAKVRSPKEFNDLTMRAVAYYMRRFPEDLDLFIQRLNEKKQTGEIDNLLNYLLPQDNFKSGVEDCRRIFENIDALNSEYSKCKGIEECKDAEAGTF